MRDHEEHDPLFVCRIHLEGGGYETHKDHNLTALRHRVAEWLCDERLFGKIEDNKWTDIEDETNYTPEAYREPTSQEDKLRNDPPKHYPMVFEEAWTPSSWNVDAEAPHQDRWNGTELPYDEEEPPHPDQHEALQNALTHATAPRTTKGHWYMSIHEKIQEAAARTYEPQLMTLTNIEFDKFGQFVNFVGKDLTSKHDVRLFQSMKAGALDIAVQRLRSFGYDMAASDQEHALAAAKEKRQWFLIRWQENRNPNFPANWNVRSFDNQKDAYEALKIAQTPDEA